MLDLRLNSPDYDSEYAGGGGSCIPPCESVRCLCGSGCCWGCGWGAGAGVLELLERLMTRVGADVMGTVGLSFPTDLSLEGDVHVEEEKAAALRESLATLEAKVLASV